ncbi:PREDICTED: uncharacterized protein LOC105976800 [Erythranthe guttata]|uniref:uncharacterized protein LOC105976800 n=1 Tax=Erythranthe guttata TaxID=4155 RepID=UPI00064D90AC|nr:PREDICTED: uncharacterized protein LOC105976800 [Erythranthe guttata]|eukprot:XP_012857515.1 PREDICTED: uncharacterized protein LOC105976800 [Erythranthe guttata]
MASLIFRRLAMAAGSSSCGWPRVVTKSSSFSSYAPWLLIENRIEDIVNNKCYNFYSMSDQSIRHESKDGRAEDGILVGSSHGWLALYKWRQDFNYLDMFLYNPRTNQYVDLPPIETSSPRILKKDIPNYRPTKVILSCSPQQDDDKQECRAIMSFGPLDRLACCRPEHSKQWTFFKEHEAITEQVSSRSWFPRIYKDFVYSLARNKLLCVTRCDNYECWDLDNPFSPKLIWRLADNETSHRTWTYLVFAEKIDRLFVVHRHVMTNIGPYQTTGFKVYELIVDADEKGGDLRLMDDTLDGMAFFIGSTGHGFVLGDGDDEEMIMMDNNNVKPNSIYFTDPKELTPLPWDEDTVTHGGHDIGVFNYKDQTFSSCYYPRDLRNLKRKIVPTPTWFMPSPP